MVGVAESEAEAEERVHCGYGADGVAQWLLTIIYHLLQFCLPGEERIGQDKRRQRFPGLSIWPTYHSVCLSKIACSPRLRLSLRLGLSLGYLSTEIMEKERGELMME